MLKGYILRSYKQSYARYKHINQKQKKDDNDDDDKLYLAEKNSREMGYLDDDDCPASS